MKITKLNLITFGPFNGTSLDFSGGNHGLHIVYGPNEAGKSSSLRALTDWLYGLPPKFQDDFRHSKDSVRLGGRLLNSDGTELAFVRRKGRKKTLRCENDKTLIEDSKLEAFLGNVDRAVFTSMFGIDHHRLRSGGEDLATGKGKLGETLFAAGAGLFELQKVQNSLQADAGELLKDTLRSGAISSNIKAYDQLKAEVKASQLTVETWQSHRVALERCQQRKSELDEQIGKRGAELARLERFLNAAPAVSRWNLKTSQLEQNADAPLLPDGFGEQVQKLLQDVQSSESLQADHKSGLEVIDRELEKLSINQPLLRQADAIEDLRDRFGQYRASLSTRAELAIKVEAAENQVRTILEELGRGGEPDAVDDLRLPRDKMVRIQDLGRDHSALLKHLQTERKSFEKLNRELEKTIKELAETPAVGHASKIRKVLQDAQAQGDLDQRLKDADSDLAETRAAAERAVQQIPLFEGSLADLETMSVPLPAAIDDIDRMLKENQDIVRELSRQRNETVQRLGELASELKKLESGQPVPTQPELDQARAMRERGWQLVLEQWEGDAGDEATAADFVAGFPAAHSLAAAYRESVAECDRLADLLRIDAERVAEKSVLESDLESARTRKDQLDLDLKAAETDASAVSKSWHKLWASTGLEPLSPDAMRDWLRKREAIVESMDEFRRKSLERDHLVKQRDQWLEKVANALKETNLDPSTPDCPESLADALGDLNLAVDEIQATANARQNLESKQEELQSNADAAQADLKQTQEQLDRLGSDWAAELETLGLEQDALPGEVNQRLSIIGELIDASKSAAQTRDEIEIIDRFVSDFETDLRQVLTDAATHLLDGPPKEAFSGLTDELKTAIAARDRRDSLLERKRDLADKLDSTNRHVKQQHGQLLKLAADAGAAAVDDLPAAAESSRLKRTLQGEIRGIEDELVPHCAGLSFSAFAAQVDQENSDKNPLRPRIDRLKSELAELNDQLHIVIAEVTQAKIALTQFDGNDEAVRKNQQCEGIAAKLEDQLRSFAVLKIASVALKTAIERHREKNQGPVLGRASEIFSEITLGQFASLQADFDEKGEPVLVGIRGGFDSTKGDAKEGDRQSDVGQRGLFDTLEPQNQFSGERVSVSGMSDGTCDQLYLALRLAALESWLSGPHEPMPFIVDDILMNFDDQRSAATLKVLAELSRRTQVIFFTHHQHLVELAGEAVSPKDLFVSTLAS